MKKVIRLVMSCLVLINVFMTTAFAAVPSPEVYTSIEQKSNLCDKSVSYSIGKEQSYARRVLISRPLITMRRVACVCRFCSGACYYCRRGRGYCS